MGTKESPEFTDDDDDAQALSQEEQDTDDALIQSLEGEQQMSGGHKEARLPDEQRARHDITQKTLKTGWKKRRVSSFVPRMGIDTLTGLPATIGMIRSFMKAINWKEAQAEVLQGLSNTVAIVGQPNTGKSTLFNQLKGQNISAVSPHVGTTRTLIRTDFGPFTLIDTPGHLPDIMEAGIEQASLIVFLLDGEQGLRPNDRNLLMAVKEQNRPMLVVVNKIDTLRSSREADELANTIAMRLGMTGVIPISARTGTNIAEELVPAMIQASPEAALVIGRELPVYRREAAQRIIRNATLVSLAAGLEPIPLVDIPILLGTQVRLVLRLAALYGEPIDTADALKHARELVVTMVSGLGLRFLAEQAAKLVPFGGDVIAGAIAGAATWSIGEVALEYYEGGKRFDAGRLRALAGLFYRRFRRESRETQMRQQMLASGQRRLTIEQETPGEPRED